MSLLKGAVVTLSLYTKVQCMRYEGILLCVYVYNFVSVLYSGSSFMSLLKGAVVTLSVSLRKGTVYVLRRYTFVCMCVQIQFCLPFCIPVFCVVASRISGWRHPYYMYVK